MKTDTEVLDGAIASLEREGVWCQGSYYRYALATDPDEDIDTCTISVIMDVMSYPEMFTVLGECGEGAIRRSAGFMWGNSHTPESHEIRKQVNRIEWKVAERIMALRPDVHRRVIDDISERHEITVNDPGAFSLHTYNDAEGITASDIILAMKHVREELS